MACPLFAVEHPMHTTRSDLPTFDSRLAEVAAAEAADGWLSRCEDDGRFLVATQDLVVALSGLLRQCSAGPVLEVCAGRGELAEAIRSAGVPVVATDADPPAGSPVVRASAEEALRRYRPAVVLGCFVPVDAGVDELVIGFPSVRHYVVLGARIGGLFGSLALWQDRGWIAEPLDRLTRWMLTRHDVWVDERTIVRHGEAWHFRRRDPLAG